jgi:enoyl-CoA hydratase
MIHVIDRPPVRLLRIEHGKVQALDLELLRELSDALALAARDEVPALVITGTGGAFSAGVDLFRILDGGRAYIEEFVSELTRALLGAFRFPRPMVAAVNGHAIAGGAILTWCADLRVMAAGRARIGVPELRVGVPFPAAPLEIARFAAGPHFGRLVYLGETYLPEEALARGLVDEVVPAEQLLDRAIAIASQCAAAPAAAFRLAKAGARQAFVASAERLAAEIDAEVMLEWTAPETHARIRAYLDQTIGKART